MATIRGNGSKGHHYYELSVWEVSNSGNPSTNKSRVGFNFKLGPIQTSWNWSSMRTMHYTITINGVNYTGDVPSTYDGRSVVTIVSDTEAEIQHNSDGSKSIDFSFSVQDNSSASYTTGNASASGSITLTTIPRASTPTMGTATTGSAITIFTNRASDSFTHTLTYSFGTKSGTIGTAQGVGASVPWTPPDNLCTEIPNATYGTGTITCTTYSGGVNIGSKTINFTLNAGNSVKPSVLVSSITEGNTAIAALNWGLFVQGKSYPIIECTSNGIYNSSIVKYTLLCYSGNNIVSTIEDSTLSGLNNKIALQFNKDIQYTYKLRVTDSRQRNSDEQSIVYTITNYSSPTISNLNIYRSDSSGVPSIDGTYITVAAAGNISSMSNHNPMTVKIGIKLKTDQNYTYTTYNNADTENSSFNFTGNDLKIFNNKIITNSYDVIISVQDQFATLTRTVNVGTAFALLDFNQNGKAIAIGAYSQAGDNDTKLDIVMNTNINGILNVNGQYYLNGEPLNTSGSALDSWPIGCLYFSDRSTSPASLFGGTWEVINGYYIYAGNTYSKTSYTGMGTQGHTLTASESGLPQHSHGMNGAGGHDHSISGIATRKSGTWNGVVASASTSDRAWSTVSWVGDHTHGIHNAGPNDASSAHSHDIATLKVYAWRRTG